MDDGSEAAEAIERAALADLHASAAPELRERLGLRLEEVGGALISVAAAEPSILLNRALGLGFHQPASPEMVERIVEIYRQAGVARFFVQVTPDARPEELPAWLRAAGLEEARRWMKFTRGTTPPPEPSTSLEVREIGPEHAADFARIAAAGFDLLKPTEALVAGLIGQPGWNVYMSFEGDVPAGTGALLIRNGVAYLDWGATDPAFRRRGGQGAVIARRVREAIGHGCRLMVTTTGEAVPGDPQHSYRNIQRAGFEEAYLRANWAPPRRVDQP
jgi:GNAT superfamily N-acetyltransferase